jgi:hypothetical protein
MSELAGRSYIPKLYTIMPSRAQVVGLLTAGIQQGGGRVLSCSFPAARVAPIYLAAEDGDGRRYGMLLYPFTTTFRPTKNRPDSEHRFQIRFGDPARVRNEPNLLGHDPAGVDITLVLAVDPELGIVVGLDPLVYADLPMGISGYYNNDNAQAVASTGWAVWAREKRSKARSGQEDGWEGIEAMVGFKPDRLLDYCHFEALATSLGLDAGPRLRLAETFTERRAGRHELEGLFGLDAVTILDIVESNFRLGVAVRGSVAEHHLGRVLEADPAIERWEPIDTDGQPDFRIWTTDGRELTVECKNALRETYKDGDPKVETQKTRDSGAGRKYPFDAFDVLAACMFSVTGSWTFKLRWTSDLVAWTKDQQRIAAIQRIDDAWVDSFEALLGSRLHGT